MGWRFVVVGVEVGGMRGFSFGLLSSKGSLLVNRHNSEESNGMGVALSFGRSCRAPNPDTTDWHLVWIRSVERERIAAGVARLRSLEAAGYGPYGPGVQASPRSRLAE